MSGSRDAFLCKSRAAQQKGCENEPRALAQPGDNYFLVLWEKTLLFPVSKVIIMNRIVKKNS